MATVFNEVQRTMPNADQDHKLHALKGLWTVGYRPTPTTAA